MGLLLLLLLWHLLGLPAPDFLFCAPTCTLQNRPRQIGHDHPFTGNRLRFPLGAAFRRRDLHARSRRPSCRATAAGPPRPPPRPWRPERHAQNVPRGERMPRRHRPTAAEPSRSGAPRPEPPLGSPRAWGGACAGRRCDSPPARRPRPAGAVAPPPPPPPWRRPSSFIPPPARRRPPLSFSLPPPPPPPACRAPPPRPRPPSRSAGKRGARRGAAGTPRHRPGPLSVPSRSPRPRLGPGPSLPSRRPPPAPARPAAPRVPQSRRPPRAPRARPLAQPGGGAAVTQAVCATTRRGALSRRGSEGSPPRPAQLRPAGPPALWSPGPGPTELPNSGSFSGRWCKSNRAPAPRCGTQVTSWRVGVRSPASGEPIGRGLQVYSTFQCTVSVFGRSQCAPEEQKIPFPSNSLLLRRGNGPLSVEASHTMGENGSQRTTPVFLHGRRLDGLDGGPQRKRQIGSGPVSHRRTEGSFKVTLYSFGQNRKQGTLVFERA